MPGIKSVQPVMLGANHLIWIQVRGQLIDWFTPHDCFSILVLVLDAPSDKDVKSIYPGPHRCHSSLHVTASNLLFVSAFFLKISRKAVVWKI